MVHLIVAMTPKGVIGKDGDLPWHIPSDLKHFKKLTGGQTVVMGRKTFESLKMSKGLPNRINYVVTRDTNLPEDTETVKWGNSLEDLLSKARARSIVAFIIGGATIYDYALKNDLVDTMHISFVKDQYDGDTFFPEYDKTQWKEVDHIDMGEFVYVEFKKIKVG